MTFVHLELLRIRCRTDQRTQELCESRGDCPGLPVPYSSYRQCGRRATLEEEENGLKKSIKKRIVSKSKYLLFRKYAELERFHK